VLLMYAGAHGWLTWTGAFARGTPQIPAQYITLRERLQYLTPEEAYNDPDTICYGRGFVYKPSAADVIGKKNLVAPGRCVPEPQRALVRTSRPRAGPRETSSGRPKCSCPPSAR
jgi:hypothetical protein